ncbi:MAG TPA: DUF177 domain-containing protein [Vicinamibacterales bacterium]|nr:DUF177 domain-containing protein [Vicinamibacterales bacterium]
MLIDLSRFRGGLEHLERTFDSSAFEKDADAFRVVAPVQVVADLRKDTQKVRLVGRVTTTLELDCSRCLESFRVPIDATFDVLFLPSVANTGDGQDDREVGDEDLGVSFYKDDTIDLGEVIREQFFLALPMKPLCREDCQGLCPVCGKNRNREACECQAEWVDPRLDALRAFKKTHQ